MGFVAFLSWIYAFPHNLASALSHFHFPFLLLSLHQCCWNISFFLPLSFVWRKENITVQNGECVWVYHNCWKIKEIYGRHWFLSSKLKELKRMPSNSVLEWSNNNFLGYIEKLSVNTPLDFTEHLEMFLQKQVRSRDLCVQRVEPRTVVSETNLVQPVWMSLALV